MCFGPTSQNRFLYKDLVKKHFEDVEKVEQVADTRQCFLLWNEHAKKLANVTSIYCFSEVCHVEMVQECRLQMMIVMKIINHPRLQHGQQPTGSGHVEMVH